MTRIMLAALIFHWERGAKEVLEKAVSLVCFLMSSLLV